MRKSALQPRSRKTPRGGRMMARMILQMSLAVKAMVSLMRFLYTECVLAERCIRVEVDVAERTVVFLGRILHLYGSHHRRSLGLALRHCGW